MGHCDLCDTFTLFVQQADIPLDLCFSCWVLSLLDLPVHAA